MDPTPTALATDPESTSVIVPKPLEPVAIQPPPTEQRVRRNRAAIYELDLLRARAELFEHGVEPRSQRGGRAVRRGRDLPRHSATALHGVKVRVSASGVDPYAQHGAKLPLASPGA